VPSIGIAGVPEPEAASGLLVTCDQLIDFLSAFIPAVVRREGLVDVGRAEPDISRVSGERDRHAGLGGHPLLVTQATDHYHRYLPASAADTPSA